ncbi:MULTISPECIES: hypothetical protein [Enterobacter]|uniref:Uncharacterized protein n=1 Tax=Enterobacter hormaechei TaxID=158836 RepID=A0AAW8ZD38_9ENTR|nr:MULTISPECIES: hypothetical protein [Enterobacter]EGK60493.1 hypothetical protein HMPREF9086_2599 [Enterobacter hormaechei ATCC 49162]KLW68291.1 hypothetical protein SK57_00931 [Enterobacter sp. BIDMC87]MCW4623993.1 hypothetical protein [Enterobacter hormaechei]MDA4792648.1 hypothetical protein [Enterobacter hormaechei]MDE7643763.1 hypothetical protein [Enterobacter hormaechei]
MKMLKTAIIETILQLNLESHHDESLVVVIGEQREEIMQDKV